jgi:predicted transcriptional regulator
MSRILSIVLDDATEKRLQAIAGERFNQHHAGELERERQLCELAESAVSEAALDWFRDRGFADDPAREAT